MIAAWSTPLARSARDARHDVRLARHDAAVAPRVSYQGEPGAFGEAAIVRHWHGAATPVGTSSFARAIALLLARRVDAAVLPHWNSAIGEIAGVAALLREHADRLVVVDEVAIPVQHALLALPGATIDSIRAVGSHPAALAQCARFLAEHPRVVQCVATDTAGAARQLASLVGAAPKGTALPWYVRVDGVAPESLGAIASEWTAERYGLVVLARGIQDDAENETRFAVVSRRAEAPNG
jgi:prephenate dehydratase